MVSCAFATAGIIEIANVSQINPLFIVVVLQRVHRIFIRLLADQRK
jgi:hypothetical protein